jgi:hypothetical protein
VCADNPYTPFYGITQQQEFTMFTELEQTSPLHADVMKKKLDVYEKIMSEIKRASANTKSLSHTNWIAIVHSLMLFGNKDVVVAVQNFMETADDNNADNASAYLIQAIAFMRVDLGIDVEPNPDLIANFLALKKD